MLRRILALALTAAAFAASQGDALASSAGAPANSMGCARPPCPPGPTQIDYGADPGETNHVSIVAQGSDYKIDDPGSTVQPGDNCDQGADSHEVICHPTSSVSGVAVNAGDGNDQVTLDVSVPATVDGGDGNDTISGGTAGDELTGGPGTDTVSYADRSAGVNVTLDGQANDGAPGEGDNVGSDVENIVGSSGNDNLSGDDGPNTVDGGTGNDTVDGGGGDDTLDGGGGADFVTGGPGVDTVTYAPATAPVDVSLDGQPNDGQTGEGDNVATDVENVVGGSGDDTITGDGADNALSGGPGADTLDGGAGADTLAGGSGPDTASYAARTAPVNISLDGQPNDGQTGEGDNIATDVENVVGGSGNDTIAGSPADNALSGGGGNDSLSGGLGNDNLQGGPGADDLAGGGGFDEVSYSSQPFGVLVTLDGVANDGPVGEGDNVHADIEKVGGGAGDNTMVGSGDANDLGGGPQQDYIDGSGGPDLLAGGGERDVIRSRDGVADHVDCGAGADFAIVDPNDVVTGCERFDNGVDVRPALRKTAVVKPAGGVLTFGLPGMHRLVPLLDRVGVPLATMIDAHAGVTKLTAARGRGLFNFGKFSGGAFQVRQPSRRGGLTELTLRGGDFAGCSSSRGKASAVHAAARRVIRRLFGNAHGHFRTRGRNSSATVRGTMWTVEDRCDGTLTSVTRGTVTVRDFRNHRTVTLHAGQQYLARSAG